MYFCLCSCCCSTSIIQYRTVWTFLFILQQSQTWSRRDHLCFTVYGLRGWGGGQNYRLESYRSTMSNNSPDFHSRSLILLPPLLIYHRLEPPTLLTFTDRYLGRNSLDIRIIVLDRWLRGCGFAFIKRNTLAMIMYVMNILIFSSIFRTLLKGLKIIKKSP
jgi:hypothetical protein